MAATRPSISAPGPAPAPPWLDVRPLPAYAAGHAPGSGHIPLEELPARMHELPAKGGALQVFDTDPARSAAAVQLLRQRGYVAGAVACAAALLHVRGTSAVALWQPSPFLVEMHDLILATLPAGNRRALDIGCGAGREAVWLAQHGWTVTAVDILPDALAKARDLAQRNHVSLNTVQADVRRGTIDLQAPYELILMLRFVQRPLWTRLPELLAPGGYFLGEAFHLSDGAAEQTPAATARRTHRLDDGEYARALRAAGLEIVQARDDVSRLGRRLVQVLARRGGA